MITVKEVMFVIVVQANVRLLPSHHLRRLQRPRHPLPRHQRPRFVKTNAAMTVIVQSMARGARQIRNACFINVFDAFMMTTVETITSVIAVVVNVKLLHRHHLRLLRVRNHQQPRLPLPRHQRPRFVQTNVAMIKVVQSKARYVRWSQIVCIINAFAAIRTSTVKEATFVIAILVYARRNHVLMNAAKMSTVQSLTKDARPFKDVYFTNAFNASTTVTVTGMRSAIALLANASPRFVTIVNALWEKSVQPEKGASLVNV